MKRALLVLVSVVLVGGGRGAVGCSEEVATAATREGVLTAIAALYADHADLRWQPDARRARTLTIVLALEQLYPAPADYRPFAWAGTPPGMTFDDAELFGAIAELRSRGTNRMPWEDLSSWLDVVAKNLGRRS